MILKAGEMFFQFLFKRRKKLTREQRRERLVEHMFDRLSFHKEERGYLVCTRLGKDPIYAKLDWNEKKKRYSVIFSRNGKNVGVASEKGVLSIKWASDLERQIERRMIADREEKQLKEIQENIKAKEEAE